MCNGHADTCDISDPTDPYKLMCRCQHNTCGAQCEQCCPGSVQKAWRQSKAFQVFQCERNNSNRGSKKFFVLTTRDFSLQLLRAQRRVRVRPGGGRKTGVAGHSRAVRGRRRLPAVQGQHRGRQLRQVQTWFLQAVRRFPQ